MKAKVIDVTVDGDITKVTIGTRIGKFTGTARFNREKDPLEPSQMTGGQIAEFRAWIKYYDELIKRKEFEIKGLKRLRSAAKVDSETWKRASNLIEGIVWEIDFLIAQRYGYKESIKSVIDSRGIYVRSRQTDHKARAQYIKNVQDAMKVLGQNSSKEE